MDAVENPCFSFARSGLLIRCITCECLGGLLWSGTVEGGKGGLRPGSSAGFRPRASEARPGAETYCPKFALEGQPSTSSPSGKAQREFPAQNLRWAPRSAAQRSASPLEFRVGPCPKSLKSKAGPPAQISDSKFLLRALPRRLEDEIRPRIRGGTAADRSAPTSEHAQRDWVVLHHAMIGWRLQTSPPPWMPSKIHASHLLVVVC